ncbi:XC chemokine receptor 1 [Sarotherodon galilaeus]
MGTAWFAVFGALIIVFQVSSLEIAKRSTCVPGFESELLIFRVSREHLRPGMRLGRVGFTDCTNRTIFLFGTDDNRFGVKADGVLTVNREVVLHNGHQNFFIHSWDSQGQKITVPVSVVHYEHYHGHHHGHQCGKHHHGDHIEYSHQHHSTEVKSADHTENATDPQAHVLQFPNSVGGLRRRKRDWVIPPLNVPENQRGTYPLKVAQIRSNEDKTRKLFYSITGPGADLPPVGRFKMDRQTGNLYVTQPLDREETAEYTFEAHAVVEGAGQAEAPMEIIVHVIDQNDNKPYFTTEYKANIAEATAIGTEVVRIEAKDDDEPDNLNSDIRYRILNQDPPLPTDNMFEINPITGSIRVTGKGLDREKYPQYTLTVQAADMAGEGLSGQTKVILTVTDSNDNAPVFTQTDWVIPPLNVPENQRGTYPLKVAQPPVDRFTMDRQTGNLYVTQPLDREETPSYRFEVHAVTDGAGQAEAPMEIIVNVIDQNDNKPYFTKQYNANVAEATAIDDDEPDNLNSDIRYRIMNQDPLLPTDNMFEINPVTGSIRITGKGLDREKYPQYTLTVQAADMAGEGLSGQTKVILTLTDSNDNTPVFTQKSVSMK